MVETNKDRLEVMERKLRQIKKADELLKDSKSLRELGKQLDDAILDRKIKNKEKEIRKIKDSGFKHRTADGRLIRKKIYDDRGVEI